MSQSLDRPQQKPRSPKTSGAEEQRKAKRQNPLPLRLDSIRFFSRPDHGVLLLIVTIRRSVGEAPAAAAEEAAVADASAAHLRPRSSPHQDRAQAQPGVEGPPLLRRPRRRIRPRHLPHIGTV